MRLRPQVNNPDLSIRTGSGAVQNVAKTASPHIRPSLRSRSALLSRRSGGRMRPARRRCV